MFVQRISEVPSQHNVIFLGEEVEDILESTGISDEHRKDYSQVLDKFDAFFCVRKNVLIEYMKFNHWYQLLEEPAEQGEMIHDRIVVGI